jgi:hypothetical protein
MRLRFIPLFFVAALITIHSQESTAEFFEARIRPVLASKCYACHTDSKLGGLRLDSRVALLEGGKSGPAIVVGMPDESLLIRAITHQDPKLKMPMTGSKLKDEEIADLKYWIKIGAPWGASTEAAKPSEKHFSIRPEQRKFWSFQPLQKPDPPAVENADWVRDPIDRFVLAKLEQKGIRPAAAADKRTLLRRVTYDLVGLPPTLEQIEAFQKDNSADAFEKIVDRLLVSPHFGERWGRHWLDVARYSDLSGRPEGRMVFLGYGMAKDGYLNSWRYRDWVIGAFNNDMPYDRFVKAQIAADLLPESEVKNREELLPGLGLFGIGPWFTGDDTPYAEARADERDDKLDVLSKGFLGLTVTCARCHDHKYDPISQKDYYALAGVFGSSGYWEYNEAPKQQVDRYKDQMHKVREMENAISEYANDCTLRVAGTLAEQTVEYMMSARRVLLSKPRMSAETAAAEQKLDAEILERWVKYLDNWDKEHPYLKQWFELMARGGGSEEEAVELAKGFHAQVVQVIAEKKSVNSANREMRLNYKPDPNEARVLLPGDLMQFELFQYKQKLVEKVIPTNSYYAYRDVIQGGGDPNRPTTVGIFETKGEGMLRFLHPEEKAKLDGMQAELKALSNAVPAEYPYLMGLKDNDNPSDLKLNIRGNPASLGEVVHRGLPAILGGTESDPLPFTEGSGRLQLAEAIVRHPLAARVIVNRIWLYIFGRGIVDTPGNFGFMGERPSHPELLDYLANRLIEYHWSVKSLIREILLTSTYQQSYKYSEAAAIDVENRLLWRANLRRLDVESLRDSLLFAAGLLDERIGGPPTDMGSVQDKRRTLYLRTGRSADRFLQLFDFPNRTVDADQRNVTNTPLQGLFFMNSDLMAHEAEVFAARLEREAVAGEDVAGRIERAYRLLFGRGASEREIQNGRRFLEGAATTPSKMSPWQQYSQVLLSSPEFYYVN